MEINCKIKYILLFATVLALTTSCNKKKAEPDIITHKEIKKIPAKPISMQDYNHSEKIEWNGLQYTVNISRRATTDSTLVVDDSGNKYHNNRMTVRVVRADGTDFLDKTFTKDDFTSVISAEYRRKNVLLGIVVDHIENDKLCLAASVGAPDALSDEYMPLLITISGDGAISIAKDNRIDKAEQMAEEEE